MLLLEEVPYDLRLPLSAAQVTTNTAYQLGADARTAFSKTVRFDVLVQQFIGVERQAVARKADQAQALKVRFRARERLMDFELLAFKQLLPQPVLQRAQRPAALCANVTWNTCLLEFTVQGSITHGSSTGFFDEPRSVDSEPGHPVRSP